MALGDRFSPVLFGSVPVRTGSRHVSTFWIQPCALFSEIRSRSCCPSRFVCQKRVFRRFLGNCWPILTSGDLFLTKSAVPDATVMFVLRDPDPFVVQCSFGALKRPFMAFSGLGDLFGMLL